MTKLIAMKNLWALFGANWKLFLGIHVLSRLLNVIVLLPVLSLIMGWMVMVSGDAALTDQDILLFVLSPIGLLLALTALALSATVFIFELAAMFIAAHQRVQGHATSISRVFSYLLTRFQSIFQLAFRLIAKILLVLLPFLVVAGLTYKSLLTEFDINYYLTEHPPAYWYAFAVILVSLVITLWALYRLLVNYVMALPLLLLEQGSPGQVMATSKQQVSSRRKPVALFLVTWAVVSLGFFALNNFLLDQAVAGAGVLAHGSLQFMAYAMGGLFLAWSVANFVIGFVSVAMLCLGTLVLFQRQFGPLDSDLLTARLSPAGSRSFGVPVITLGLLVVGLIAGGWFLHIIGQQAGGERTEIIAHRGASAHTPENTMAAMEEAISEGADWLEIDVQETAEGEVVVMHDRDLMKMGGSPLRVWDAPLSELQAVDIGSRFDPRFSDQRVPTLKQLLEQVKGRVKVNIELKYYGNEVQFEQRVADIVEATGMQEDIVLMSLSLQGVRKMKSLRPDWSVGLLSSVAVGNLAKMDVDFFAINARFASRSLVSQAEDAGKGVMTWTVNDPVMMSAMMSLNVDGIITDEPGLARRVKMERAQMSNYELFLLQLANAIGTSSEELVQ